MQKRKGLFFAFFDKIASFQDNSATIIIKPKNIMNISKICVFGSLAVVSCSHSDSSDFPVSVEGCAGVINHGVLALG